MSRSIMRRGLVLLLAMALLAGAAFAASNSRQERKLKTRVTPEYSELAKRMNLHGTVRMEVVIAPDGTIKSAKALGGNPVLIRSAADALKKWRYEPGPEWTTVIEFRFHSGVE